MPNGPRPGNGPLCRNRRSRRRNHRPRLGRRNRRSRRGALRTCLRQATSRSRPLGPRRSGRLGHARCPGPCRQNHRHRSRPNHRKISRTSRRESPCRILLGRDRSQSSPACRCHRRSHRNGLVFASKPSSHRRYRSRIRHRLYHESLCRCGTLEARESRKSHSHAPRRDRRRQQSRVAPQRSPRRSRRRSRCFAGSQEAHHLRPQRPRLGCREHHHRRSRGPSNHSQAQSGQGPGHRRIPAEQDRALMRILKLTSAVEKNLLRARHERDLEAERIARHIIADVRKRGDDAVLAWAKKLDRIDLRRNGFCFSEREINAARKQVKPEFMSALRHAEKNIRRVAEKQLPRPWSLEVEPGVTISQLIRPLEAIGCYIPGGRLALVSTLLMTVVPARVAGVKRVAVVCPKPNPALLAAASLLGITQIAGIGGAQAIAALAYGTKRVPRVDKIFGPGNRFVTAAKQLVSSDCAIDLPAGPTEALVLASTGNPRWIAADLLAQAEHAPDASSYLVTTSTRLARQVQTEVARQLQQLP